MHYFQEIWKVNNINLYFLFNKCKKKVTLPAFRVKNSVSKIYKQATSWMTNGVFIASFQAPIPGFPIRLWVLKVGENELSSSLRLEIHFIP